MASLACDAAYNVVSFILNLWPKPLPLIFSVSLFLLPAQRSGRAGNQCFRQGNLKLEILSTYVKQILHGREFSTLQKLIIQVPDPLLPYEKSDGVKTIFWYHISTLTALY